MADTDAVELDADERDDFLGNGGTGVISFSTPEGTSPHSIPVSYGYDAATTDFYFRLSVGPDREKGDLDGREVSFVVYGRDGDEDEKWKSVLAKGRLEDVDADPIATETLEELDRVHIPLHDVFGEHPRAVSFEFFRLDPEVLTAHTESSTEI
ncbi:pyridoxamine 5'-phosphate oxidase family protein [Natrialbaceae archaeon AArc-T1-2]|uniref:pyridoxamine 5'-phosphate oxidase family protein n=1 Tax=Natrialbaceae archaeon AArc-T1-2 TaxID=3053904 RepID=UPI00255AF0AF|nr:pyridoxamine 5'-phosphate oxidase family protein [Natrialbaceae archaeon AArc-T1-2]WIV66355.1 pyridoxamine 5'-phosphate oxidase family protein [Natrialbaceae archaeon AArc-T1-2]